MSFRYSDGSISKFLTQAELGQFFVVRVGSGQPSLVWFGFGKFPLKILNFSIFALRVKKISSARVKKYLCQRQVGLLFTVGQKYARVGSGPISRPDPTQAAKIIPGSNPSLL